MTNIRDMKVGDTIVRPKTNARRKVLSIVTLNGNKYIVSQYLSSNTPRVDSIKYFSDWKWEIV